MQELTGALWFCHTCKKVFYGPIKGEGELPCGHTFDFGSAPEEVVQSMHVAMTAQDLLTNSDFDAEGIVEALEAAVND